MCVAVVVDVSDVKVIAAAVAVKVAVLQVVVPCVVQVVWRAAALCGIR